MSLNSKKLLKAGRIFVDTVCDCIFARDLCVGLNIPFVRNRQLFCVVLDPGWTPDLACHSRPKNTWRSMGLRLLRTPLFPTFLCRFGPPIYIRGGL